MRLCRFGSEASPAVGFYDERGLIPIEAVAAEYARTRGHQIALPNSTDLLAFLPHGAGHPGTRKLADFFDQNRERVASYAIANALLLLPVPRPNKIFLLAGNYAEHIREGGGVATERDQTFPYVFMKPPSTTLTPAGQPIFLPAAAPDHVDWELELAVVIGQRVKNVSESDALAAVAGYTIINDISQRRYRPNPNRKLREKDAFFDWLHGKWFDSFCPCGPCVTSADAISDPQTLRLTLTLNGQTRQDASTAQMIFPVAALIAFISRMVTLEPGDLISTGTPAGVGSSTGTFLKVGDVMHGSIERIGTLVTTVMHE